MAEKEAANSGIVELESTVEELMAIAVEKEVAPTRQP